MDCRRRFSKLTEIKSKNSQLEGSGYRYDWHYRCVVLGGGGCCCILFRTRKKINSTCIKKHTWARDANASRVPSFVIEPMVVVVAGGG